MNNDQDNKTEWNQNSSTFANKINMQHVFQTNGFTVKNAENYSFQQLKA